MKMRLAAVIAKSGLNTRSKEHLINQRRKKRCPLKLLMKTVGSEIGANGLAWSVAVIQKAYRRYQTQRMGNDNMPSYMADTPVIMEALLQKTCWRGSYRKLQRQL